MVDGERLVQTAVQICTSRRYEYGVVHTVPHVWDGGDGRPTSEPLSAGGTYTQHNTPADISLRSARQRILCVLHQWFPRITHYRQTFQGVTRFDA